MEFVIRARFQVIANLTMLMVAWLMLSAFGFSSQAPQAWQDWAAHRPGDARTIEHTTWSGLLEKYIHRDERGLNRFAYGKVSDADRAALGSYIKSLEGIEISGYNRDEQLAYWLNLYNAVTVKVILDHYPVSSIKDIDISGLLRNGPWQKELVTVEATPLTLDDIEHAILRPIWKTPLIHYGVNCASVGCPNLQQEAFTAANVHQLLEKGAREYVNSPRGVDVRADGSLSVSFIYTWFAYDFGNSEQNVLQHLLRYANADLAERIAAAGEIADTHYDWSLNE